MREFYQPQFRQQAFRDYALITWAGLYQVRKGNLFGCVAKLYAQHGFQAPGAEVWLKGL